MNTLNQIAARARCYTVALLFALLALPTLSTIPTQTAHAAATEPQVLIENAVNKLIDEFTARRAELEGDRRKLFDLVERVAVPLFDLDRISKLVLAKNWKRATATQRIEFRDNFKDLLIATYATALYAYSGDERIAFIGAELTERKGRQLATVKSEVRLGEGAAPVPVDYAMLLTKDNHWRIYNLTINGLSMIANYRGTYAAAVDELGIDGVIASIKEANAKNY